MGDNDSRYIQIGLKVAYYRKLRKLTQEQLAEQANISSSYLSHIESPTYAQPISLKMLFLFADIFRIPPKRLVDFDEDE